MLEMRTGPELTENVVGTCQAAGCRSPGVPQIVSPASPRLPGLLSLCGTHSVLTATASSLDSRQPTLGARTSVVIPTRVRPAVFLPRALASLRAQTLLPYEVILAVDGDAAACRDAQGAIDGPTRAPYPIHVEQVRTPGGRSRARNTALGIASGDFIAYLDDDDWYYPRHLEILSAALVDVPVAYAQAFRVYEAQDADGIYRAEKIDRPYGWDFDAALLREGNYIPILSLMHRRSCLLKVGGFDPALESHEDWDLFCRLSLCFPFRHVAVQTCGYSWRSDSSTSTADMDRTRDIVRGRYGLGASARLETAGLCPHCGHLDCAHLARLLEAEASA